MRKFLFLFVLSLFVIVVNAQSDFDIAQSFMSKKGVKLADNPSNRRVAVNEPYKVFKGEQDKGFAIVVNGKIVGYSTESKCHEVPPQLKEMLESYAQYTNESGNHRAYPSWFTPRHVTSIEPLIKTKWGQGYPFNKNLNKSGICGVVAFAQVFHYYKVSRATCEINYNGKVLQPTTFDHSKMINFYNYGYTQEQADEVAKLYEYIYGCDVSEAVFSIKKKIYYYTSHNLSVFESLDSCLEKSRPLATMGGGSGGSAHYFVIDGRDSDGLYHVNFGWDGSYDGYYIFTDNAMEHANMIGNGITYNNLCNYFACASVDVFLDGFLTSVNEVKVNHHNKAPYKLVGDIYIKGGKKYIKR